MPPPGGGGQQPQQQGGSTENHMAAMWILVAVFVFGYLIWAFFKGPLVKGFFYLKLAEINILDFFTNSLGGTKSHIQAMMPAAAQTPFGSIVTVANQIGHYLLLPVIFLLVVFSILLYFRSSVTNFRHIYDMKKLLKTESVLWPQTTPVIGKNLVDQHIEKGPWAMSLTPLQFAKKHKLLKVNTEVKEGTLHSKNKETVSVLKDKAAEVFARQLGSLWPGVDGLNMHTKALFAAIAAHANADDVKARELLYRIAASSNGRLDFSGTDELIKKYANTKVVKEVIKKHAYTLTVMSTLLETSRRNGVFASADFLWLKPIDRRLWFMLNTVGRQTAPAEVGGPFAHWLAEIELGRKIKTPMVQGAVAGLEEAVNGTVYRPDEDNEKEVTA